MKTQREFKPGDKVRIVKDTFEFKKNEFYFISHIHEMDMVSLCDKENNLIGQTGMEYIELVEEKQEEMISVTKSKVIEWHKTADKHKEFMELFFGKELFEPPKPKLPETWEECLEIYLNKQENFLSTICLNSDIKISNKDNLKLQAIAKMLIVAEVLAGDWKADWNDGDYKWYITRFQDKIFSKSVINYNRTICHFELEELADLAIKILGDDCIKQALS